MQDAVIVDAIRTPVGKGKPGGALSGWHPVDLLAHTLAALVERTGVDPALVDDVIAGCVSQAGEQTFNIGRNAVLAAGFPDSVPATTIDRQCGSSQQAVHFAAQGVMAGAYDVVIACGVEQMSRVPMFSATMGADPFGTRLLDRYAPGLVPQGISAELIAAKWDLSRQQLDEFAARSHELGDKAYANGFFDNEILPVPVTGEDGAESMHTRDETLRASTTAEKLGGLRAVFQNDEASQRFPEINWHVTAGNASPLTDGASAVLIMSAEKAKALGLTPRAKVSNFAVVGDDPLFMLTGIIPATAKLLDRAGIKIDDIDAFEVNEAFAPVVLAWLEETGADLEKVNSNGGAIALGHPLGASGGKLLATLLNTLEQRDGKYGLQTMCEGGGMANATLIERL